MGYILNGAQLLPDKKTNPPALLFSGPLLLISKIEGMSSRKFCYWAEIHLWRNPRTPALTL